MFPIVTEGTSPKDMLEEILAMLPPDITGISIVLHTRTEAKSYQAGLSSDDFAVSAMLILQHLQMKD